MTLTRLTFIRAALAASLLASLIATASPAAAQKEWLVHSFRLDGSQGIGPVGNLVADGAGNLYGIASRGGAFNSGTVYELVRPVPPKTAWTLTVLYSFTGGAADGATPEGGLVFDNVGNLYGTTSYGGGLTECIGGYPLGCGVVFELSPPTIAGHPWTESVLHTFSAPGNGDGSIPSGQLIRDGAGSLYGTAGLGGETSPEFCASDVGCGIVFQLSPPGTPGGVWAETILYSFVNTTSGLAVSPQSGLVFDSQGNLYGTAVGGEFDDGLVYRLLRPATAGGTWTYKVLHTFGPVAVGSPEGGYPRGSLTLHGKGVLYGTTSDGGVLRLGTVFQLVPPTVAGGTWTENILYSFDNEDVFNGQNPLANVIFDSKGNMYGTAAYGGATRSGLGVVFELTPPASDGLPWTETTLHSFNRQDKDGSIPTGGLLFGKNGVLFGTTEIGGLGSQGALFALLP